MRSSDASKRLRMQMRSRSSRLTSRRARAAWCPPPASSSVLTSKYIGAGGRGLRALPVDGCALSQPAGCGRTPLGPAAYDQARGPHRAAGEPPGSAARHRAAAHARGAAPAGRGLQRRRGQLPAELRAGQRAPAPDGHPLGGGPPRPVVARGRGRLPCPPAGLRAAGPRPDRGGADGPAPGRIGCVVRAGGGGGGHLGAVEAGGGLGEPCTRAGRAPARAGGESRAPAAGGQRATQDALAVEGAVPLARGGAPLAEVPADTKVATLFAAVAQRRPVRFSYGGLERRVDPWRLSYRQGKWYLAGFDHQRGAERLFRVDRIATEVATEGQPGAFSRPAHVAAGPPPPWRLGDDEEVAVELRVDASQVPFVASLAGPAAVARTEADGSARFRLTVTNRVALRNFVLGFLEHAEVVGPPQVRDDMVSWLRRLVGAEGQP